ncbi:MAG: NAD(P)H-dependent oxidoreductase subunit E [Peptoclostridium sp.]|uniref:NADH-quinone oxidoreductase subunit NuoE family protein n=1 Tax=Peptoclostridium sp. TaxID=1904860 RepID=UPI00139DBDF6|nr:NAD(P)H-dependent oxidoreductase subunit E [Peptoclostridium sp.]MZQ75482.1 NAD(P)H-dependent oxidoreductase subunit E [Peptoclostridium sp.]
MEKSNIHEQTTSVKDLPQDLFLELRKYIDGLEDKKGSLINILHKAQEIFGFLPREVQLFIAKELGIPGAQVFGVVSFYSYFTTKPTGKNTISLCMGTACFVKGADKVKFKIEEKLGVKFGETTPDGLFTLRDVRCVGACGLAPVVLVNEKVYGNVTEADVERILSDYQE